MNQQPVAQTSNRRMLMIGGIVLGILLVLIAVIYFASPASALPAFFPGYTPGLATHHIKHGIAALILGLGAFALSWFNSGPARAK